MTIRQTSTKRPRWSLATSFWFCVGAIVVVTPVVFLTVHKSIWVDLEMVTGILAVLLFAYFSVLLHQGVRFNDARQVVFDWPRTSPGNIMADASLWPDIGSFAEAGSNAGILGMILGFLLDVVATVVLAFLIACLLWAGINVAAAIVLFFYWMHRRCLRYLVTRGRHCKGSWGKSILRGGATAVFYSLWFYAAFFVAQQISAFIRP